MLEIVFQIILYHFIENVQPFFIFFIQSRIPIYCPFRSQPANRPSPAELKADKRKNTAAILHNENT